MHDTCPPMGNNLGPDALGLFSLLGMYQGITHPLVGSIVNLIIIITGCQCASPY